MSIAFTLDAGAFGRAAGILEREPARVERDLRRLTQHRARLAKEALARATPVGTPQPGQGAPPHEHMQSLWHQETTGPAGSVVFNEASYSMFLFSGTGAHEIRARNAHALHFFAGGSEVFTGSVDHPGTAPSGPLLRALDDQLGKAEGDLFDYGVAGVGRMAMEIA